MRKRKVLFFLSLFAIGCFFNSVDSLAKEDVNFKSDFEKNML